MSKAVKWTIVAAMGLLVAFGMWAYRALDEDGWIAHTRPTDLYVGSGEWPAGQMRNCAALPAQDGAIIFLGCVAGSESFNQAQNVAVKYWGRIKRRDRFVALAEDESMEGWKWRCQRRDKKVTCWAVN